MSANVASLKAGLDQGRRELQRFGADASRSLAGVRRDFALLRTGIASLGIGVGLREVIAYADAWKAAGNQLRIAAGGAQGAAVAQERLFKIAQETRTAFVPVVQLYSRLSLAAKELGASQEQLFTFTEGVGKALSVSNTSAEQASGALLQLSQALGGGVVRAEEFNSILEGAPRLALAAAQGFEGMGGSVAKLRKAVIEGKITSADFFDALMIGLEEVDAEFASTQGTIGQALTGFDNALTRAIGKFDEGTNAGSNLAEVITAIADELDGAAKAMIDFANTTKQEFAGISRVVGSFLEELPGALNKGAFVLGLTDTLKSSFSDRQRDLEAALSREEQARPDLHGTVLELTYPTIGPAARPLVKPSGAGTGGGKGKGRGPAGVIADLKFEIEQLNRSPVDQAIFKALDAANVSAASAMGQQIAALATALERLKLAKDAADASFQRGMELAEQEQADREAASERAQQLIADRNDLEAGLRREFADRQALAAALEEGARAYEIEGKFQEIANQARELGLPLYGAEIDKARELAAAFVDLDRVQELNASLRELGNTLQSDVVAGLTAAILGTQTWDEALNQLIQDAIRGLLEIANQASATGNLGESIFGYLTGSLPSVFGGGGGTATGGAGSDIFGGLFAAGGRPPMGRISVVGEDGPEWFVPDSTGTVIPHDVSEALAMGGGGMVVNIDARGATREFVAGITAEMERLQAEHVRLRREVPGMAVGAVKNERTRSPAMRSTFR